MDMDAENIHSILLEANLPTSINDLKNPTQDYVVNLLSTFLTQFYIDVYAINKPFMEQQDAMGCFEDSDIIGLINLHVVIAQICERIFLTDLCITDITNPGSKRIRRLAKFLANFILYTTNKVSDIQDRVDEIRDKAKLYQDMIDKKNKIKETINDKALHNATQLSLKEKYTGEIRALQSKIAKNSTRYHELISEMTTAEEKKKKAVQTFGNYKSQSFKLSKAIADLKSKIVTSPEEYQMRLEKLEEQRKQKMEEREAMQEAFQDKKQLVEQQENILAFVKKQLDKVSEVQQIYEELKKLSIQEDNAKRQVETLKANITEMEKKLATQQDQIKKDETKDVHAQHDKRLSSLRALYAELLSNKKFTQEKLKVEQSRHSEASFEKNKIQGIIKKIEEEIVVSLKNYQELYDNEIMIESAFWKT